jgi:hypothetical protein
MDAVKVLCLWALQYQYSSGHFVENDGLTTRPPIYSNNGTNGCSNPTKHRALLQTVYVLLNTVN